MGMGGDAPRNDCRNQKKEVKNSSGPHPLGSRETGGTRQEPSEFHGDRTFAQGGHIICGLQNRHFTGLYTQMLQSPVNFKKVAVPGQNRILLYFYRSKANKRSVRRGKSIFLGDGTERLPHQIYCGTFRATGGKSWATTSSPLVVKVRSLEPRRKAIAVSALFRQEWI